LLVYLLLTEALDVFYGTLSLMNIFHKIHLELLVPYDRTTALTEF